MPTERDRIVHWHRTGSDVVAGIRIDATVPVRQVVDEILRRALLTAGA